MEEKECNHTKSATELFFKWLSDFTMPIVQDKIGVRIIAATIGLVVGTWVLSLNADNIAKITAIFK